MEWISYIGLGFAFLLTALALLAGIVSLLERLNEIWRQRKHEEVRNIFLSDIHSIGRWCGYEFPVLEFLETELAREWSRGVSIDPSEFRKKLRNQFLPAPPKEQGK